ncbi:MAG: hypothetical protein H0T76_11085 [Nannocystis sp.]|nr:DUF6544 family protein [Nannocystis sp.]MBA3547018.1 hypothetical protein [Nannocystis sp.]
MRIVLSLLLGLHGAIHLLGFVKGLGLAEVPQLQQAISTRAGVAWLAAALLLMGSSVLALVVPRVWWMVALPGVLLSQLLIIGAWQDAKFGTLANAVLLVPLVIVIADQRPQSLRNRFVRDTASLLAAEASTNMSVLVTEADLAPYPQLLQRYLKRAGVVGKPRVHNVRLTFTAQMRNDPRSPWMESVATQYEFYDPPARLFFMQASRSGVPFDVFHRYVGNEATFQVRVAGLIPMVNQSGPLMTRSETVTLFNDMCLLAPGSLIGAPVTWTVVDESTLRARYTNAGHTIEAVLSFDASGDIANFVSLDRGKEVNGEQLVTPWDTPVSAYATFHGVRIVGQAEARYEENGEQSAYGRFTITGADFNVRAP